MIISAQITSKGGRSRFGPEKSCTAESISLL